MRSDTKMEARTSRGPRSLFVAPSFVGATWGLRKIIIIPFRSSGSNDLITLFKVHLLKVSHPPSVTQYRLGFQEIKHWRTHLNYSCVLANMGL